MAAELLTRRQLCRELAGGAAALALQPGRLAAQTTEPRIKAFCIDFNWGPKGFAPPGMYAQASPKEHFQWYQDLGVNTVQTFCVSCCGYAWYQSTVPPVQPGMKGDFLREITDLGHQANMRVMGYFCIGANSHWGKTHPDLSHGDPSAIHIPFTTQYLDYLARSIEDVMRKVPIDGFMIDWLFNVAPKWLDCERKMYEELLGRPFPSREAMDEANTREFLRRANERAWTRIHTTTKSVRKECTIWLSCHDLRSPQVAGSKILKEVDWLMNEHPDSTYIESVRSQVGPDTRMIQCICGWGAQHDAGRILSDPRYADMGMYGFARPDPTTTLPPPVGSDDPNAKNIEIMRKAFRAS